MILVKLMGGLGNQMFQYACAAAMAGRLHTDVWMDLGWFAGQTLREFQLTQWAIPENSKIVFNRSEEILFAQGHASSIVPPRPQRISRPVYRFFLNQKYRDWSIIIERQPGHYQNLVETIRPKQHALIVGYWQSEQYFNDMAEHIREVFSPHQALSREDQILADTMQTNKASVSVHIRCGDYLDKYETWKMHYVCTPAYYQDAFRLIAAKLAPQRPYYYIFSDNHDWVKKNIDMPYPYMFVSNKKRLECHEISLMSKCNHHIIANSSFSWWGAWLNQNEHKIVFTPPRWFNNSNRMPDIVPQQWEKCPENEEGDKNHIDRPNAERRFIAIFGKPLDLRNPSSFNEKMQWIKLYERKTKMTLLCDKLAVRDYVARKIGPKYLNKIIDVYDRVDDIDFSRLPESFVLKATHGDWNILCPDKTQLNERKTLVRLRQWLGDNYYYHDRDWCYKHVEPRIICEAYIHSSKEGGLQEYKIFCFNGEPRYIQVDIDRHTKRTRAFYDPRWEKQPFTTYYPLYPNDIPKPKQLEELLRAAKVLCNDLSFARVNFYGVQNRLIFGEITLYHGNGFEPFYPREYDYKLGGELCLPVGA